MWLVALVYIQYNFKIRQFDLKTVYDAADKHLSEDYFRWWFNCVSFIYGSYVVAYVNPNDFNRIKAADLSRLSFLRLI